MIGRRLTELPFTCLFGTGLVFHKRDKSKVMHAALYWMTEAVLTFRCAPPAAGLRWTAARQRCLVDTLL